MQQQEAKFRIKHVVRSLRNNNYSYMYIRQFLAETINELRDEETPKQIDIETSINEIQSTSN